MSENSDGKENNKPEKKLKDNVSPDLRPKNVHERNYAPRGSIAPVPSMSPSGSSFRPQQRYQTAQPTKPANLNSVKLDQDRPLARITHDKEVDDFYSDTNEFVEQSELDRLTKPEVQQKLPEPEDRPIAIRTGDKEVDADASKTNRLVDEDEFKRLKKEAIKKNLQKNRERNRNWER